MKNNRLLLCIFILLLSTQMIFAPMTILPTHAQRLRLEVQNKDIAVSHAPIQASDIRFGYNYRVTDGSSPYPEQVEPTLTILNTNRLLIGWKEADTYNGPGRRVGFCYSDDEGQTFSPNILIETLGINEYQSDPWLISDTNDNAYFAFLEYNGPEEGMGVAKTVDGGLSWNAPTQASDTSGYLDDKETACVDADGNIYMMWDHFVTQNYANLVFTRSSNGGASFQPTQILGSWDTHGGIPYLTCTPNGTLFASTVWDSNPDGPIDTIFFMKSTNYGTTWTSPQQVNPPGSGEIAIITVCATDSQHHIYICYAAGSPADKDVYVIKSIDAGISWSDPVQVNDDATNMQRMVEMHIDEDDDIHVAWLDARNNEWDIYYSYSDDGGTTFSQDVRITTEGFPLSFTRPGDYFTLRSGPSGRLFIVWTDGRSVTDQDIYLAKQDMATPELSLISIDPPTFFEPVTIIVKATDDDHLSAVSLFYQIDQGVFRYLPMSEVTENMYQATIPGSIITGTILSYYFGTNDTAGRYTRLPSESEGVFIVQIGSMSPTLIITIIIGVIIIVTVVLFAVWYLRKD
ncbi:MAG: sialidase family protein [Promethearchaeota archaeon]